MANSVREHVHNVEKKLLKLIQILTKRAGEHDKSKLTPPECYGWDLMDKEPKYPYGSPEYFEKMQRYNYVFKHHYSVNSHHPEHYPQGVLDMDLIDMCEMLCDWLSYKDSFTRKEGIEVIIKQCQRFNVPPEIELMLIHTFERYLCIDPANEFEKGITDGCEQIYADVVLKSELLRNGVDVNYELEKERKAKEEEKQKSMWEETLALPDICIQKYTKKELDELLRNFKDDV